MELPEALAIVVGRTKHRRWLDLCDPSHPDYDPNCPALVMSLATGKPAAASGTPPAAPAPPPLIPLAGDIVAGLAAAVGADRLAKWTAKQFTGVPSCGCAARQDKLNEIDLKARKLLRRLAGRGEA